MRIKITTTTRILLSIALFLSLLACALTQVPLHYDSRGISFSALGRQGLITPSTLHLDQTFNETATPLKYLHFSSPFFKISEIGMITMHGPHAIITQSIEISLLPLYALALMGSVLFWIRRKRRKTSPTALPSPFPISLTN